MIHLCIYRGMGKVITVNLSFEAVLIVFLSIAMSCLVSSYLIVRV